MHLRYGIEAFLLFVGLAPARADVTEPSPMALGVVAVVLVAALGKLRGRRFATRGLADAHGCDN
jgi:hypothetical protein